jgi:hypothetical protein
MITAVSGVAMATTAATGGAAVLLGFMSTTKTTVVAATLATIIATGFGIAERNRAQGAETRLDAINQEQISLRTRLAQAEKQLSQAETRAAEADRDSGSLLAEVEAARAKQVSSPRSAVRSASQRPVDDPSTKNLGAMFPNGIVVTIGDKTITVDDVGRELAPLIPKLHQEVPDPKEFSQSLNKLQNDIVKSLVERDLLIKEFSIPNEGEAPRQVPATAIDQTFADILTEQFSNDPAKFAAYLDSRGMTPDQYRKSVEEDITFGYMLQQQRKLDKNIQKTTAK